MLDIRAEATDASVDWLAILGMAPDLAWQGEERQRALQIDFIGHGALGQAGAPWLLAVDRFAKLHIRPEAAATQRDFKAGLRILSERSGADLGRTVGRDRERTRIAAFGIIGAADKGAEFAQLEREPPP